MPQRLKKPCAYNGCPELVKAGTSYCVKHEKKVKNERNEIYDRNKRNPKFKKFYSSNIWRRFRKIKITKDPLCEHCLKKDRITPATEVDHIIPIKVDWDKRLVMENVQSLCHSCHMKKSAKDREKYKQL